MKKEKLSDAVGMIDNDLIEEADEKRKACEQKPKHHKSPLYVGVAVLTAAAAAVTGVVVIPKLTNNGIATAPMSTTAVTAEAPVTVASEPVVTTEKENKKTLPFVRERKRSSIISDIEAVGYTEGEIAADTEFRISLFNDVSEDVLRDHLNLEPKSEFTLTRDANGSYLLRTNTEFDKGSMVRFTAEDDNGDICDSWAFHTAENFDVSSTYPYDGYTGISQYSGVEIEFTTKPMLEGIEDFIEITPDASVDFSVNDRTLYIVPNNGLKSNTAYTVKLKAGLPSVYGGALEKDYEFSFRTSVYSYGGDHSFLMTGSTSSGFSETFIPGDQPCVELHCSEDLRKCEFETHLYRFGSSDDYFAAMKERAESIWTTDAVTDTSALTEVFRSKEVPFTRENENSYIKSSYIMLPDDLAEGYYIADITTGDGGDSYTLQYMIQVSPVSVFALSLGEENVFFVNDTVTGQPASGAKVTMTVGDKEYDGVVGSDGLAYVKTGGEHGRAVLNIGAKGSRYIDSYILSDAEDVIYEDLYYLYLFTDRQAYLPNDTVNVWGVIVPKSDDTPLPDDLTLTLDSMVKNVSVNPDGSFNAKFKLDAHLETYWNPITLKSGKDTIISRSIQIEDYVKPTYDVEINTPEYIIMPQLEPFDVTINASYYEGTPAEGIIFSYSDYSFGESTPKMPKTDGTGSASARISAKDSENESWQMGTAYVGYTLTGVENDYRNYEERVPVFMRDRMDKSEYDADTNTLTVSLYDMDFGKIDEFMASTEYDGYYRWGGDYNILKGKSADSRVTVELYHSWNEATETGSYYDYIEKKTVRIYTYNYKSEELGPFYADTENGKAVFTDLPMNEKGGYTIKIYYPDSLGHTVQSFLYPSSESGLMVFTEDGGTMWYDDSSKNLVYRLDAQTDATREANSYSTYTSFSEDENITFDLKCSNNESSFTGKVLFAVYQNDLITYEVHELNDSRSFTYKATKDCIPDARYTGAYFDGRHVYKAYGSSIIYDPRERGITLTASSDRDKYDAGDKVVLSVKATDDNGSPIEGATVLLSFVDEAAFAIADQKAEPLDELYRYVYYPTAKDYISYIQHFAGNGSAGEKGGGGPEAIRKDFKDTAYFDTAETDYRGYAFFAVYLPDNLTTWRATFIAIYDTDEDRMCAGTSKLPVVATRPLFITPIMHTQFIEGDDIAVSAKCAGLPSNEKITVNITGSGTDETIEIGQQETANFGKLPAGEYKVLFSAEYDGNEDAMEMTLNVAETLLETDIHNSCDLEELSEHIAPTKWPATIAFFDKEYMSNTQLLCDLLRYSGDSLDMRLGAAYAAKELGYMTDEEIAAEFGNETADGYARLLPASEKSNTLTALMCAAMPGTVSSAAKEELENNLGSADQAPANYMGLAALGEPVLTDVKKYIKEHNPDYTTDKIYLSAALAYCGDYQAAFDAYITCVPKVVVNDTDPEAIYAYVPDESGNASQAYTKAALITASILDLPEAEYFARYLTSGQNVYNGYALELVIYLENYIPDVEGDAVFTYELDGQKMTAVIDRHHPTILEFSREQFENANFKVQSGAVYTISHYVGRVDRNETSPSIKVTKSYEGTFAVGETITVHIHASPDCSVYDVVPSCGRLTGSNKGQLVRLYTDENGNAQYTFTVSTAGNYVTEPTVVYRYSSSDNEWGMSARGEITVGESNEAA